MTTTTTLSFPFKHISETTVRHHLTTIFDKLSVSNRFELVFYAYRHGLAKPPC